MCREIFAPGVQISREDFMRNLKLFPVGSVDYLVHPDEFDDVTLDAPALAILTDFKSHRPHVVESHLSAVETAEQMLYENIRVKLVINRAGDLVGLVTSEELSEQNILLHQVTARIKRTEVLVADVMLPREAISAIPYADFSRATVADIIDLLQRHGERHCFVVDQDNHHIRGVVSTTEIARRLHAPVVIDQKPNVASMAAAMIRE
jgi:CBS domain-containing protein